MQSDREHVQNVILDWCGSFIASHPRNEAPKAIIVPSSVSSLSGISPDDACRLDDRKELANVEWALLPVSWRQRRTRVSNIL